MCLKTLWKYRRQCHTGRLSSVTVREKRMIIRPACSKKQTSTENNVNWTLNAVLEMFDMFKEKKKKKRFIIVSICSFCLFQMFIRNWGLWLPKNAFIWKKSGITLSIPLGNSFISMEQMVFLTSGLISVEFFFLKVRILRLLSNGLEMFRNWWNPFQLLLWR